MDILNNSIISNPSFKYQYSLTFYYEILCSLRSSCSSLQFRYGNYQGWWMGRNAMGMWNALLWRLGDAMGDAMGNAVGNAVGRIRWMVNGF